MAIYYFQIEKIYDNCQNSHSLWSNRYKVKKSHGQETSATKNVESMCKKVIFLFINNQVWSLQRRKVGENQDRWYQHIQRIDINVVLKQDDLFSTSGIRRDREKLNDRERF